MNFKNSETEKVKSDIKAVQLIDICSYCGVGGTIL